MSMIGAPYPVQRDAAAALARETLGAAPRELLFAAIVGSHAEGYAAPDSDVDVRGVFVYPTEAYLGLHAPPDEVRLSVVRAGIAYDVVLWEIGKWARMVEEKRGNAAELLYSPLVLADIGVVGQHLRGAAWATLCRHWVFHYLGHARTCYTSAVRVRAKEATATIHLGSFVRAVRLLLGAHHLLRTGRWEVELPTLLRGPLGRDWVYGAIKRVREDGAATEVVSGEGPNRYGEYLRDLLVAVEQYHPDWLPEAMPQAARDGLSHIVTFYRAEPGAICTAAWQAFTATQEAIAATALPPAEGVQAGGEVADGGAVPGLGGDADRVG